MESQDDIFLRAQEIADAADCARYLDQACKADAALKARVEAMLRDAEGAEKFFGTHVLPVPAGPIEKPGMMIGRYKLLQVIGEGGMGVVYMAEQREPVVRKVAVKIIKLGMDTRQVVARFEAERQALALMDHPNIAKVLDGGTTDSGKPYFVMELVQGLPITQFCDERSLPTVDRLKLFLEVCSAVQHAHQKGVIHRDIKPSNILVTLHGDRPVPKIIDFGVAKATQGRLTDKTLFTQFQQFIGTPAYMSPEQANLSGLDVDTRSDIYALGVLLYELLTGKTPFDPTELLKAGLDEIRRTIREKEPPRPSTRLSTLEGDELKTTAKHRHIEAPKLLELIRGDLDWIVMKCLEKDRSRRYETANGLAMDLERHLANEPVLARPPSAMYRMEKAIRRHKVAFAAAIVVASVLILAAVISTWQAVRATRAERHAISLQNVVDFDRGLYRDLWVARGYETEWQTNQAAALMQTLYPRLAGSFPQHLDDCLTVARAFVRFEKYEQARSAYELIRKSLEGGPPSNPYDLEKLIEATAGSQGWPAAAEVCRKLFDILPEQPRAWRTKAMVFLYVGDEPFYARAASKALSLAESATNWPDFVASIDAIGRNLAPIEASQTRALELALPRLEAGTYEQRDPAGGTALAAALYRMGKLDQCMDSLKTTARWQGPGFESRASHCLWALVYERRKQPVLAYKTFMMAESLGRTFSPFTQKVEALGEYENFLTDDERYYLVLRREALKTIPGAMMNSLARRGRWSEAAAEGARCLELCPTNAMLYGTLAPVYLAQSDIDAYRQLCVRMLAQFRETTSIGEAQVTARACLTLPSADVDVPTVSKLAERAARAAAATRTEDDDTAVHCWFTKGLADYRQGHFAAATNSLKPTIDYARTSGGGFEYLQARSVLAMTQFHLGQTNEARNTLAEAIRLAELHVTRLRKGDLSCDWYTDIRDRVLLQEARALIEGK